MKVKSSKVFQKSWSYIIIIILIYIYLYLLYFFLTFRWLFFSNPKCIFLCFPFHLHLYRYRVSLPVILYHGNTSFLLMPQIWVSWRINFSITLQFSWMNMIFSSNTISVLKVTWRWNSYFLSSLYWAVVYLILHIKMKTEWWLKGFNADMQNEQSRFIFLLLF